MHASPILSVVIPTRDRSATLQATFTALAGQAGFAGACEVLVVDDGSSDDTPEVLRRLERQAAPCLRWWSQAKLGPATARNAAIRQAGAPRILLLGDDTLPAPGTLAAHLAAAGDRQVGVQGLIEWDPARPTTHVMRFLAPAGPQFYFAGLTDGEKVPFTAVLGSNLSAPTQWFLDDPFDEGFPNACGEDTELAYRWHRKGRHAVFCDRAVCWHRHHYDSMAPFLERQRRAGRAARHAVRRHPALLLPMVLMPTLVGGRTLLRLAVRRSPTDGPHVDLWDWQCRWHFLKGFLGARRAK